MKIRKVPVTRLEPLAHLGPYIGPCLFCGGPDKRHRLADAIVENVRAGDSVEHVAEIYEKPVEVVRGLVRDYR